MVSETGNVNTTRGDFTTGADILVLITLPFAITSALGNLSQEGITRLPFILAHALPLPVCSNMKYSNRTAWVVVGLYVSQNGFPVYVRLNLEPKS